MPRRKRRSAPLSVPRAVSWGDEVHPSLDLHGMTADEALRRTEAWLRGQREDGMRTVRVITGRGTRSVGPPVLRGEVEALLRALRGSLVTSYALDSGGGAFRVELSRAQRERRPPGPRFALPADPTLRRRAEEALWELGVEPTPALLAAEVRRLLREGGEEP